MNNFVTLFKGEIQRMIKYHILTASVVVAFFWMGMIHLLAVPDITFLFTMVVFFDLVSMSIVMVGVTIFFEKQEGVLKSLIVSPISKLEYITAKILGNLISNLVTIILVYIYALIFQEINVQLFTLIMAILLIALFHSFMGILLIYKSRDFTQFLVRMMSYFLIFILPIVLEQLQLITARIYSYLIYLIPTKSSASLIEASTTRLDSWELIFSISYLILGSAILSYFVFKGFKDFAIRESGV